MVLVIVVPMLAPIIIGTAPGSESVPDATSATVSEVVAELLWIMAVTNKPINNPVNGFDVASKIVSVTTVPNCCSDEIIKSRENKNTSNPTRK